MWFAFLTLIAAPAAYYQIFAGFSFWDDEGALMTEVNQVLHGLRPYQDVWTVYGPVYFLYACGARILTGTPVSHDAIRLTTLLPWLATPLLLAWIVLRTTRSIVLATAMHFFVVRSMVFLRQEPGHPHEPAILLLAALFAAGFLADSARWRTLAMVLLGGLAAALIMIKINLGIFALMGLALVFAAALPERPWTRVARLAVALAGLLLPAAVTRTHLDNVSTLAQAVCVTAGFAGCCWILLRERPGFELPLSRVWIFAVSFAVPIAAAFLVLSTMGVPWRRVLYNTVWQPATANATDAVWYFPPHVGAAWTAWAVASLLLAVVVVRIPWEKRPPLIAVLQFAAGSATLLACFHPQGPELLMGFATGLCWLPLCRVQPGKGASPLGRGIACTISAIHVLIPFPIAGSQMGVATIPLLFIAVLNLGDALAFGRSRWPRLEKIPLRAAVATAMIVAVLAYAGRAYAQRRFYESLSALDLPGAERVHLPAGDAENYRWIARNVSKYCDTLIGYPEMPSMHLWSGVRGPARVDVDNWMYALAADDYALSADEQEAIVRDMARFPRACVVYNPKGVNFWNTGKRDFSGMPLVRYIFSEFQEAARRGTFCFMVRKYRVGELIGKLQ
jgi:hypothetical protein